MGIQSWKAEFYPVKVQELPTDTPKEILIKHSLTKWIGLRPENLKRHEVKHQFDTKFIFDSIGDGFQIDDDSCSLCYQYRNPNSVRPCELCPLSEINLLNRWYDSCTNEYQEWSLKNNPEPMIQLLEKALDLSKNQIQDLSDSIQESA